ncbi:tryptophan halogenase family protein [Nitrospirillum amazonense]|uniref:tryptophan halogenase family protein n=1 Tax=Nitrospirillum amazonense TaxID=28077 RepID=UPI002DD41DB7|nr:tryptophan halogenase family protein [Nitrospirillum amazonense]MEC4594430.1 tryptophan halogenase family protein [Nitrospirillum amazonense]
MTVERTILIVGGGTAGWLAAAYLAKYLGVREGGPIGITLLEAPDIGIVGVGEGTFPTIRGTLRFLGLNEAQFMRDTSATFKQGIRFARWVDGGEDDSFFHPFEAPFPTDGAGLVPYWLLQDGDRRPPFAQAMTFQQQVTDARRAPKRGPEGDFEAPLNYAYHFDAAKAAQALAARARELGVRHLRGTVTDVALAADGAIAHLVTREYGAIAADFYVDCSGFRAELIGRALGVPQKSVKSILFTDRALSCKVPYEAADTPLESCTVATAHAAGWTWEIGLEGARGVGCVYSSDHMSDDEAEEVLRAYVAPHLGSGVELAPRKTAFDAGYRETPWVRNCVAIGLAGGFLEPLESTSVVLIEVAVGMLAELFPHDGRWDAPAARFNELMTRRFENIVNFLKLHYCLSKREEPFWRDNRDPASIPPALRDLLAQWRTRPPSRFDFALDLEAFAFFNYQYILYGMGFETDLSAARAAFPQAEAAQKTFARIRAYGDHATKDLPAHRALIRRLNQISAPDGRVASRR